MKLRLKVPSGIDWSLYLIPLLLTIFGIVIIFSITYGTSSTIAFDQIVYTVLGFGIAISVSLIDYRMLKGLYLIFYVIGILLLILVIFFGSSSFGASRWIDLGIFRLQPSELFKLISIIFLAKFFSDWKEIDYKKVLLLLAAILIPAVIILKQPDLGTASVVVVATLAILLRSPIKKIYIFGVLACFLVLSPLGWKFLRPYQQDRIKAFINPASDPRGAGYNVSQSKIAIGSGGIYGMGLGKGSQSQLNFLPVAHTDFIFAGAAESTGFIGSLFLISLLGLLLFRAAAISSSAQDDFGMYLSTGIGAVFLFQTFVNIGMNLGIMPVTGIPLPFVSYGGSAMFTNMAAIGILQSIYMRHKKIKF